MLSLKLCRLTVGYFGVLNYTTMCAKLPNENLAAKCSIFAAKDQQCSIPNNNYISCIKVSNMNSIRS